MEHPLDHRERTLPRRPLPAYPPVPQPVPDTKRVTPSPTPHRRVPATRHSALIPLTSIHYLTRPGQVNPAVMYIHRGRLHAPDQPMIQVHLQVQLVPEEGFAAFLGPSTIPAPPCLVLISAGLVSPSMPRVRCDERRVLHHTLTHL